MLNREKYAKEIIEIACNGGNIAVVNGKLENCRKTQCNECNFNGGTIRDCEIKTRKWANSEYVEPIEPQVDWSRVPVDTPILVRHSESCGWDRRYFAKYNNGLVYAWKQGTTSWSAEDPAYVCDWKYAKLAEDDIADVTKWKPSIHMPKEAARIWLKVTDVKIERLQDVTEDGAKAEGAIDNRGFIHSPENEYDRIHTAREHFIRIWNSTIKKSNLNRYGWDASPWVWVIEFERCEKPETKVN